MPIHACLEIPEIRGHIFKHHEGNYPTLLALALTCRTFTDSALDVLWRNRRNLVLLVRTMSPKDDLWTAPRNRNDLKHMKFLRGVEDKDMKRFLYYSRRIRNLRLEKLTETDLPRRILSALTASNPAQTLLPQISRLVLPIDRETNEIACYLPSFLSSTLTDLELRIHVPLNPERTSNNRSAITMQNFQFFLTEVARIASSLRSFRTVLIPGVTYDYSPIFEPFVEALPNLVNLSCEGLRLTPALLQHLGSNRALLKLNDVCLDGLPQDPYSASPFGSAGFVFLKELRLLPQPLDRLSPLLEALDSPLEVLYVTIDDKASDPSLSDLERLCSAIAKCNRLTTLSVRNNVMKAPSPSLIPSIPIFSQLLRLHHLEIALISLSCVGELELATLSLIPTEWPSISRLSVTLASPYDEASPKVTLEKLAAMTCKCAQLESLSIPADLRPFQIAHPLSIGNESVKQVYFFHSVLSSENLPSILRCLCIMFPSANHIEGAGTPVDDWLMFQDLSEDFFQPVLGPEWF